jgi:hypothetical protein
MGPHGPGTVTVTDNAFECEVLGRRLVHVGRTVSVITSRLLPAPILRHSVELITDRGGAMNGRHIDVYRLPPASPTDLGRYMTSQRILVIPPR